MTDVHFRLAYEEDAKTISFFIKAMLKEMESVGGHEINPDELFVRK